MSTATQYPHLTIHEDGTAFISGSRYRIIHIASEHHRLGWSAEEILRQHPDLRPEEVYAALTYFYDHRDAMVAQLEEERREFEELRAKQTLSREELLRRKASRDAGA